MSGFRWKACLTSTDSTAVLDCVGNRQKGPLHREKSFAGFDAFTLGGEISLRHAYRVSRINLLQECNEISRGWRIKPSYQEIRKQDVILSSILIPYSQQL